MNYGISVNISHTHTIHLSIQMHIHLIFVVFETVADRVFELGLVFGFRQENSERAKEKVQKSTNFELPQNLLRS